MAGRHVKTQIGTRGVNREAASPEVVILLTATESIDQKETKENGKKQGRVERIAINMVDLNEDQNEVRK